MTTICASSRICCDAGQAASAPHQWRSSRRLRTAPVVEAPTVHDTHLRRRALLPHGRQARFFSPKSPMISSSPQPAGSLLPFFPAASDPPVVIAHPPHGIPTLIPAATSPRVCYIGPPALLFVEAGFASVGLHRRYRWSVPFFYLRRHDLLP
jgi:hypothetical protein